jgi:hypothetical protein
MGITSFEYYIYIIFEDVSSSAQTLFRVEYVVSFMKADTELCIWLMMICRNTKDFPFVMLHIQDKIHSQKCFK